MSYPANSAANGAKVPPPSKFRKSCPVRCRVAPGPNLYSKAPSRGAGKYSVEKSREPSGTSRSPASGSSLTKVDPGAVSLARYLRYRKTYVHPRVPVAKATVKVSNDPGANTPGNVHDASRGLSSPVVPPVNPYPSIVMGVNTDGPAIRAVVRWVTTSPAYNKPSS